MKRLSKKDSQILDQLSKEMEEVKGQIEGKVDDFNNEIGELVSKFNDLRQQALDVFESTVDAAEAYFDERSEKWQEGDAGQEYRSWIEGWERYREMLENDIEIKVEVQVDELDNCIEACNDVEREFTA